MNPARSIAPALVSLQLQAFLDLFNCSDNRNGAGCTFSSDRNSQNPPLPDSTNLVCVFLKKLRLYDVETEIGGQSNGKLKEFM